MYMLLNSLFEVIKNNLRSQTNPLHLLGVNTAYRNI